MGRSGSDGSHAPNRKFPAAAADPWLCGVVLQDLNEMVRTERPDWQSVMTYVTAVYKYFET